MEKAVLLKVKSGQWEVWKKWCAELNTTLRSEAILTLEEEQVLQELTLAVVLNGEHYVIGFMDGDCLPANTKRSVNQRHNEMKQNCLEYVDDVEVLYNIKHEENGVSHHLM
jgi:hypothetical protein